VGIRTERGWAMESVPRHVEAPPGPLMLLPVETTSSARSGGKMTFAVPPAQSHINQYGTNRMLW
jgi:hypothetical protein